MGKDKFAYLPGTVIGIVVAIIVMFLLGFAPVSIIIGIALFVVVQYGWREFVNRRSGEISISPPRQFPKHPDDENRQD